MAGDRIRRRLVALARNLKVSASDVGSPRVRVTGACFIVNGRGIFYVFTAAELAEEFRWWRPAGADFFKVYDEFGGEYFVYKSH